jgi:hypothetical protein
MYRLGNGNYLLGTGTGVFEVEPVTGIVVQQERPGSARYIELVRAPQGPGDADIDLLPASFTDTVLVGAAVSESLFVGNVGTAPLLFGLHGDQAWISPSPDTGAVPAAATDTAIVTLDAAGLIPGNYAGNLTVVSNDPDEPVLVLPVILVVEEPPSGCVYVPGDINNNGQANGIDVTFGVAFLKGGAVPPVDCNPPCTEVPTDFYAAMDVNGNCAANGIDITFFVAYLKSLQPALLHCQNCPPVTRD